MFRKDFNLLHASSETTCHLFEYIVIKKEPSFYILYHVLLGRHKFKDSTKKISIVLYKLAAIVVRLKVPSKEHKCSLRPVKLAGVSFAKYQNRSVQE